MKAKLRFTTLFPNVPKEKFEDVRSSTSTLDASLVKGNSKYAALSWVSSGGGALAILDINKPARLPHTFPMIRGHNGVIMDFDFYPFNENLIITCSEDTTLRLWNIPEPFTEDVTEPLAKLSGHSKKVNLVQFHPSAESIVASAGFEGTVRVWNIESQSSVFAIKGVAESLTSLEWSYNGSQILTASRDKTIRIGDPRASAWVQEFKGHEGPKPQKAAWLGNDGYIATVGFSKTYAREMYLWSVSNLSKPVQVIPVDQQAGVLYPFYDEDCKVLYLAGKGDGNMRYYELADGQLCYLNQHTSVVPQKGIGFVPKRYLNVSQNELMRCLKLTNHTLESVTFNSMRKTEGFQEDLYPPCISGEPSLKAEEWTSGRDADPKRMSLNPETGGRPQIHQRSTIQVSTQSITGVSADSSALATPDLGREEKLRSLEKELAEAREQIDVIKYENKDFKKKNTQLENEVQHQIIVGQSLKDDIYQLKKKIAKNAQSQTHVVEEEKVPVEEKPTNEIPQESEVIES